MIHEGCTGVHMYQRERALRAVKRNCNNYLFLSFGLLVTVKGLKHLLFLFHSMTPCISVEEGLQALREMRAQIMNASCNLLIFPVAVNGSLCWYQDIGAENCHKI